MNPTTPLLLDKDIVERAMHLTPYDIDHALLQSGLKPPGTISVLFIGLKGDRTFVYETMSKGDALVTKVYVSVAQKPVTQHHYFIAKY